MSGTEELAFTVRHTVALGDRGSGWNALYTLRISFPSTLSFSLSSSLLLSASECVREQAMYTHVCIYIHIYMYLCIYIYICICWLVYLSLSLVFSAHFCPTTAARAMDNVILIYIYASDRPRFSIQAMPAISRDILASLHKFFFYCLMFIR